MTEEREVLKKEVEQMRIPTMRADLFPTECTLKYEEEDNVKILIRYQEGKLHVYTDVAHAAAKMRDGIHDTLRKRGMPFAKGFALGGFFQKMGILPAEGSEE